MKEQIPWFQLLASWRTSGLTQANYCQQHGLSVKSLLYWSLRKYHEDSTSAVNIIPIHIKPDDIAAAAKSPIWLKFHGIELELSVRVSPSWLSELLQCLA